MERTVVTTPLMYVATASSPAGCIISLHPAAWCFVDFARFIGTSHAMFGEDVEWHRRDVGPGSLTVPAYTASARETERA